MSRVARPGKWGFLLGWSERQTLDGLFRRHGDAVYRLAAATLGDREAASDVTQEVFLQAARKLGELKDPEALWPWLKTVTLNLCRDRGRQRQAAASVTTEIEDLEAAAAGCAWPGDGDLTAMLVRDSITRLAPREREVIVAYYQHGMTYREVAGHLDCSVATVQWWLDRALKRLAEMVSTELEAEEDNICQPKPRKPEPRRDS
jgi:RNA polymerase sigma factor (sigma-70 family)